MGLLLVETFDLTRRSIYARAQDRIVIRLCFQDGLGIVESRSPIFNQIGHPDSEPVWVSRNDTDIF